MTRKIRSSPAALIKPVGNISAEGWRNGTCKYMLLFRAGFCHPSSGKVTWSQPKWSRAAGSMGSQHGIWRVSAGKASSTTLDTQHLGYSQLPPYCRDVKCECQQPERHKLKIFKEKFHKGLFWHVKREANKSLVQRSTHRDCANIFYEISFN